MYPYPWRIEKIILGRGCLTCHGKKLSMLLNCSLLLHLGHQHTKWRELDFVEEEGFISGVGGCVERA